MQPIEKIDLREAKNSDLEITYQIKTNSMKLYVEKIWDWNEPYQREIHKQKFVPSETKIIQYNQQTVGYVALKETERKICIKNLLIKSEFQSLGIGKEVMKKIIEKADSNMKLIRLRVFKINTRAQKFYYNLGFTKHRETEYHFELEKNLQ